MMQIQEIFRQIEKLEPEMVELLMGLCRVPAIAPENGGDGEGRKAEELMKTLKNIGFDAVERFDADDPRVSSGKRPNIVATCQGESVKEKLWIVTHLDVVPVGEETFWTVTKPFEPLAKDDRVFGRGCEDNGQSLVAATFAVVALKRLGIKPKRTVALAFVSDEEEGSKFGIKYLISKLHFEKNDLVVVPDGGNSDGTLVELAEKGTLWFRIRTIGKQAHGSMPNKGLNANRIAMQVALKLDERLHAEFSMRDDFFDVPYSTFEPTKREPNVDAVNIVPGEDVSYFDCRVLPSYDLDEVLAKIKAVLAEYEDKTGAKFNLELLSKQSSKPVESDAPVVTLLKEAIRKVRGVEPHVGGIGGGSCAALFREVGIPAVLWSTVDEVAHQPNEYAWIKNMVSDSKVFALLAVL